LGTLLGMIHMLYGLGEAGLDEVGVTMGFALLTTLYGLVLANLVCKPLAIKLEREVSTFSAHMMTLIEGFSMMSAKKHPLIIMDMFEANGYPPQTPAVASKPKRSFYSKLLPIVASHVD